MNPRQTILCKLDAFALLAEILDRPELPIIDGGANVGETAGHIRRRFPQAPLHLFEPVSLCQGALRRKAEALGNAAVHQLALSDARGTATMHINQNLWTCSLLPTNQRGLDLHGDWCQTVATETATLVRLDEWAQQQNIDEIGVLKLDLQGAELRALRGCGDLLSRTHAVYAEAQIIPEYDGAATFAEIDLFLRKAGFGLYQIIDLCMKGRHAEPSCCDGLWLRNDVLERVRASREPESLARLYGTGKSRMAAALTLCSARGMDRVALYGAGAHTAACGEALARPPVQIAAIIDDAPATLAMWGIPVVDREAALALGVQAIVLSSDTAEQTLLQRCAPFLERGVPIVTLYDCAEPTLILPDSRRVATRAA
jgi:FkbM family methyltransferase